MEFRKDFHDKASGVLFQIIIPPNSTIGFVSNLKEFLCRRCKRFSPISSIIGVAIRVLHLPEVEGVKIVFFYPQSKQSDF